MALFGGRGPNAPTALYEVAAELGWQPVPVPGHVTLQPPTFARVDVEGITAGARSQAWVVQAPDGTTASHLDVVHDEYEESVYDMVRRAAPRTRAGLPHVELTCGAKPYQNHRLGDRFGSAGSRRAPTPVDDSSPRVRLTVSRACAPSAVDALAAHPRLAELPGLATAVGRGGFTVEVLDGWVAVFTLTAAARRGTDRWRALVAAGLLVGRILDDVCGSA